jgi:hypothetical protein
MTERNLLPRRAGRAGFRRRQPALGHPDTLPVAPPTAVPPEETLLGFPVDEPEVEPDAVDLPPAEAVGIAERRDPRAADPVAGSFLLVAGAAGLLSLFLPWLRHGQQLGLALVERGVRAAGAGELVRSGLVLPTAVAVGGGVLFLLGLLAFRPARSHRALGVIALSVALAVGAGIVVRVADLDWNALRSDPGVLCAVVLAGLGLLGALKAMLTLPRVGIDPD